MRVRMLVLAALLMTLMSCKKNGGSSNDQLGSQRKGSELVVDGSSYVNPFEFMGEKHNQVLQAGYAVIQENGGLSMEEGDQFLLTYFKARDGVDFSGQLELTRKRYQQASDWKSLLAKSRFSEQARSYFLQVSSLIGQSKPGGEELHRQLKEIETKVSRSKLEQEEINSLLQAIAIARYSAQFWQDLYVKTNSGVKDNGRSFFGKIVDVIAPIHGDFIGGLIAICHGDSIMDIYRDAATTSWWFGFYANAWIH